VLALAGAGGAGLLLLRGRGGATPPPDAAAASATRGTGGRRGAPELVGAPPGASIVYNPASGAHVVSLLSVSDDAAARACVTVTPADGSAHASGCGAADAAFLVHGAAPGARYSVAVNVLFKHRATTVVRDSFTGGGAPGGVTFLPALTVTAVPRAAVAAPRASAA
jgi:hypothetical protein